jgi:hypothetical protein
MLYKFFYTFSCPPLAYNSNGTFLSIKSAIYIHLLKSITRDRNDLPSRIISLQASRWIKLSDDENLLQHTTILNSCAPQFNLLTDLVT